MLSSGYKAAGQARVLVGYWHVELPNEIDVQPKIYFKENFAQTIEVDCSGDVAFPV